MHRNDYKLTFETILQTYIQQQISALEPYFFDRRITESIRYLPGYSEWWKRIRPYLVYALHKAFGGEEAGAKELSLAVELVHLFALVHDDIMDKGTIRHGQPTYHRHIASLYEDDLHVGVSQAILIGDILYTWANELVACSETIPHATKCIFYSLLKEVTFGQMIDIHLSHTEWTDKPEQIQRKDKMKSGYYTFMRPIMLGASLAWVADLQPIQTMGAQLGLAFQMRDDLLDIIDTETNKTPFSDLQEGNQTIIRDEVFKRISTEQKKAILAMRGGSIPHNKQQEIITLITDSGAIEATKEQINELLDQATSQLEAILAYDNPMYNHIKEVIDFMRV